MVAYLIRFLPIIIIIVLLLLIWLFFKKSKNKSNQLATPPWFYYIALAIIIFGFVLVFLRFNQFAEKPGGQYIPPRYTNEGIVPGYVNR